MTNGKLLRQLIKSGIQGDQEGFRLASESLIAEEREKNHHIFAKELERIVNSQPESHRTTYRSLAIAAMPSSRDNGDLLVEERPAIRELHDLVVAEATKRALEDILREHDRADVLAEYGLLPAQKLLFVGPPGCGKTLAAEIIANHLSLPLIVVRLDSVISSFLGETATNLRRVFDYIATRPVVALFDEFDALTKDRGDSADHGELKRSVNAVLQMMDGYKGQSLLIATTNYESLLDRAVWRRFDEVVRFNMPDLDQIKRLVSLKLSGVRRAFEPIDANVPSLFKDMSHSDIERVLVRAVKEMVLSGEDALQRQHIDAALAKEYRSR